MSLVFVTSAAMAALICLLLAIFALSVRGSRPGAFTARGRWAPDSPAARRARRRRGEPDLILEVESTHTPESAATVLTDWRFAAVWLATTAIFVVAALSNEPRRSEPPALPPLQQPAEPVAGAGVAPADLSESVQQIARNIAMRETLSEERWRALIDAVERVEPGQVIFGWPFFLSVLVIVGLCAAGLYLWWKTRKATPIFIAAASGFSLIATTAWPAIEVMFNFAERGAELQATKSINEHRILEAQYRAEANRARAERIAAGQFLNGLFVSIGSTEVTETSPPSPTQAVFSGAPVFAFPFERTAPAEDDQGRSPDIAEFAERVVRLSLGCSREDMPVKLTVFGFASSEEFAQTSANEHARRNLALAGRRATVVAASLSSALSQAASGSAAAQVEIEVHQWGSFLAMTRAAPLYDQGADGMPFDPAAAFLRTAFVRLDPAGACDRDLGAPVFD